MWRTFCLLLALASLYTRAEIDLFEAWRGNLTVFQSDCQTFDSASLKVDLLYGSMLDQDWKGFLRIEDIGLFAIKKQTSTLYSLHRCPEFATDGREFKIPPLKEWSPSGKIYLEQITPPTKGLLQIRCDKKNNSFVFGSINLRSLFRGEKIHNPIYWIHEWRGQSFADQGAFFSASECWNEAIQYYFQALNLAPRREDWQRQLGEAISFANNSQDILDSFKRQDKNSLSSETKILVKSIIGYYWNYLGEKHLNKKKLDEAKAFFLKAYEVAPMISRFHYNLGVVNQKLGNTESAIKWYESGRKKINYYDQEKIRKFTDKIFNLDPFHTSNSKSKWKSSRYTTIILRRNLRFFKKVNYLLEKSTIFNLQHYTDFLIQQIDELSKWRSFGNKIIIEHAKDLYSKELYVEAENALDLLISYNSSVYGKHDMNTLAALEFLGKLYYLNGRHLEAKEVFSEALELAKNSPDGKYFSYPTLIYLAIIFECLGEFKESQEIFEKAFISRLKDSGPPLTYSLISAESYQDSFRSRNLTGVVGNHFLSNSSSKFFNNFFLNFESYFLYTQLGFNDVSQKFLLDNIYYLDSMKNPNSLYTNDFSLYFNEIELFNDLIFSQINQKEISPKRLLMLSLRKKNANYDHPKNIYSLNTSNNFDIIINKYHNKLKILKRRLSKLTILHYQNNLNFYLPNHFKHIERQISTLETTITIRNLRRSALPPHLHSSNITSQNYLKYVSNYIHSPKHLTLDPIRDALSDNGVFLDYHIYNHYQLPNFDSCGPQLVALVASAENRFTVHRIDLGPLEPVKNVLKKLRNAIAEKREAHFIQQHSEELYRLIWQPVEHFAIGKQKVFLSLDGPLNFAPFALMNNGEGYTPDQEHRLVFLTSPRGFHEKNTITARNAPVVLYNPNFNQSLTAHKPTAPINPINRYLPLPWAEKEGRSLGNLLQTHGYQVHSLTGHSATEMELANFPGPEILHLASHGQYFDSPQKVSFQTDGDNPDSTLIGRRDVAHRKSFLDFKNTSQLPLTINPMVKSGIALAGANSHGVTWEDPVHETDGFLSALEVESLDLKGTRLVVLSACETGLGDHQTGEGVFGLTRAFRIAGAQAVLATLWSVDDEGTSVFMNHFYRHFLQSQDPVDALSQAREAMRADPKWQAPYYWAPFFLMGQ